MMLFWCTTVRRLLGPYHDGELSVEERIRVETHLDLCHRCASEVTAWRSIGDALRANATGADELPPGLRAEIISRLGVERRSSISARFSRAFEDMHFVWAALAATSASVLCGVVASAVLYLAVPRSADSLAGMLAALASPGSNGNPVSIDTRMNIPRVAVDSAGRFAASSRPDEGDLVFALAAVVTQEGRVRNPEVLMSDGADRQRLLSLLDAVASARFEPASYAGAPVAVNFIWLLAHTTVRAKLS